MFDLRNPCKYPHSTHFLMNHPFPLVTASRSCAPSRGSLLPQSVITATGANRRQANGGRSSVSDVGGDESVSASPPALPTASPLPRSRQFRLIHVWNAFRGVIDPLLCHSNDACTGAHAFPLIYLCVPVIYKQASWIRYL